MAKITIEELSDSLKEYLNGLGLTEAQVQELIDKFEDEKIGNVDNLQTESKLIVNAINENKTNIQLLNEELGLNKDTLEANINAIREVL